MPKITKVAHEKKNKQTTPNETCPGTGSPNGERFHRDSKAGQPEEKFKKSQSYNTAMCATFDRVGFGNAETLQLLTTRTLLQMGFYGSLRGRWDAMQSDELLSISIQVALKHLFFLFFSVP